MIALALVALLALVSPTVAAPPAHAFIAAELAVDASVPDEPGAPQPGATPKPEPTDAGDVVALVLEGIADIRSGKTEVGVGLLLMVGVFIARKLAPRRVPKKYLATVLLGLTAIGGFAAAIAAGLPVIDSALSTLVLGAAAIGLWEGVFKFAAEWWEDR